MREKYINTSLSCDLNGNGSRYWHQEEWRNCCTMEFVLNNRNNSVRRSSNIFKLHVRVICTNCTKWCPSVYRFTCWISKATDISQPKHYFILRNLVFEDWL